MRLPSAAWLQAREEHAQVRVRRAARTAQRAWSFPADMGPEEN